MWEKVKSIFAVIGAVLVIIVCTLCLIFLRRSGSDGRGSGSADERDSRIQEGLGNAEDAVERSRDTATRCEERLQRAEDILREAIERSRKKEQQS